MILYFVGYFQVVLNVWFEGNDTKFLIRKKYELSGVYINLFSIWKFNFDMIRWKLIYLVTC